MKFTKFIRDIVIIYLGRGTPKIVKYINFKYENTIIHFHLTFSTTLKYILKNDGDIEKDVKQHT